MTTLDKARELISMLAIAVGLRDSDEYREAVALYEHYDMEQKWDNISDKYKEEWHSLMDDWHRS